MMFWVLATVLVLAIVAYLVMPHFAPTKEQPVDGVREKSLNHALDDIEREQESGFLDDNEAEEARIEAARGIERFASDQARATQSRPARLTSVAYLALAPVFVALIYWMIGAPQFINGQTTELQASSPAAAIQAMSPEQRADAINTMVEGLSARLVENPDDLEGWRMLARSYQVLGRLEESADAYDALLARTEGTQEDLRNAIFALTQQNDLSDENQVRLAALLDRLSARFPNDPLGLYQGGVLDRAAGQPAQAVQKWRKLLSVLPPDAPIRANLEGLIADAEAEIPAE